MSLCSSAKAGYQQGHPLLIMNSPDNPCRSTQNQDLHGLKQITKGYKCISLTP